MARRRTHLTVPIPRTRDPFVNTPLVSVGRGENGVERFWITSCNDNVGCIGVLLDETGRHRLYRFSLPHMCFYSAVAESPDTIWLCGWLNYVLRLDLRTGQTHRFDTGAPPALAFQGMAFDRETGKLFAAAYPMPGVAAFSFDTKKRVTAAVFRDYAQKHYYMRASFPNGDGTWSIVVQTPGQGLLRWDPRAETLAVQTLQDDIDPYAPAAVYALIADGDGRRYFPGLGWLDPRTGAFASAAPAPEREARWFARRAQSAWGTVAEGSDTTVVSWDMASGKVGKVTKIADGTAHGVALTESGRIVCVDLYGTFSRFDARSGALELTRRLATDSVGRVDCVRRVDKRTIIGTPFITERFWRADIKSGTGMDCGRAAPGTGQITLAWQMGAKTYMGAYHGGELVEYDGARAARFPENPRVVADPPGGMRPVAGADDGRRIFYASSTAYGTLGGTLTRYDTRTGLAAYSRPFADQQVMSLFYDRASKSLLFGASYTADCSSAQPASSTTWFGAIDPETLEVVEKAAAPEGTAVARVVGPLGRGRWLAVSQTDFAFHRSPGARWFTFERANIRMPAAEETHEFAEGFRHIMYAGRPGRFIVWTGGDVEVRDMRSNKRISILARRFEGHSVQVQGDSVYLVGRRNVEIREGGLEAQGRKKVRR